MGYKKELSVEIVVDGKPLQGESKIFIENGKVDFSFAEQHFYDIMRKWEDQWLKEAEAEEKEFILDHLTKEQEEKLQLRHSQNYMGTDDDMPTAYEYWLMEVDLDELKKTLTLI